jgi:hypothetical protein
VQDPRTYYSTDSCPCQVHAYDDGVNFSVGIGPCSLPSPRLVKACVSAFRGEREFISASVRERLSSSSRFGTACGQLCSARPATVGAPVAVLLARKLRHPRAGHGNDGERTLGPVPVAAFPLFLGTIRAGVSGIASTCLAVHATARAAAGQCRTGRGGVISVPVRHRAGRHRVQ